MKRTLIVRYSRIGDALLVLPLIDALAKKYPDEQFTVLTNSRFEDLVELLPSNVAFISMPARASKGMFRSVSFLIRRSVLLYKLKRRLAQFEQVAFFQYDTFDKQLHRHLMARLPQIKVAIADDSHFWLPERLINKCNDGLTMIGIYKEALSKLSYNNLHILTDYSNTFQSRQLSSGKMLKLGLDFNKILIAFSPFSKESTKVYPLERMEIVLDYFAQLNNQYQIVILGGGAREKEQADKWVNKHPGIVSLIDEVEFIDEAVIISQCKVVLAMDSFNMHLAFFLNVPVVSVWGTTAPQNGYYPPYHSLDNVVIRNLDCQPCSMYGENGCSRAIKFECMHIAPMTIIRKIERILQKNELTDDDGCIVREVI